MNGSQEAKGPTRIYCSTRIDMVKLVMTTHDRIGEDAIRRWRVKGATKCGLTTRPSRPARLRRPGRLER